MFWKKREPQFDPEKHIGQLLLNLPACSRRVIAIDETLDSSFTCAYVVTAVSLLSWMKQFSSKVRVCGAVEEATQAAFLMWLRAADRNDGGFPARVPKMFFDFYRSYASELVKATDGDVYCGQCEDGYAQIEVAFENTNSEGGGWHSGTEVWRCPKRHLLRQDNYRGHLLIAED